LVLSATVLHAQTADKAFDNDKAFTGAKATQKKYHAIYQPDNSGPPINEKNIPIMKRICLLFNDEVFTGGGFQFWHVDGYTSFGFS